MEGSGNGTYPAAKPKLAVINHFQDVRELKSFALDNGFNGIEWSFELEDIPTTPAEESRWVAAQSALSPLEIRYHCPFHDLDLGHEDPKRAKTARAVFQRVIRLVSKAGGRYLSIHIGLGLDSTEPLSWETSIKNLRDLVQIGAQQGIRLCLENLAWGWTSKPNLFEKLIRRSGAGVTLDIGHAHACEAIRTQQYAFDDFVMPHPDRVYNAHVYHTEIPGRGHLPPETVQDVASRLDVLIRIGCAWWAIEIDDTAGLLKTKEILDAYVSRCHSSAQGIQEFRLAGRPG